MQFLLDLSLLAQTDAAEAAAATADVPTAAAPWSGWFVFLIVALCVIVPMILGWLISKLIRMEEQSTKISVCLVALTCAVVGGWLRWPPSLGVDLKGGVILIYEVDLGNAANSGDINAGTLAEALKNRLNPSGTKELLIRPYGDNQVEIVIPEVDENQVAAIKQLIEQAGFLEFRIVANVDDHPDLVEAAIADPRKNTIEAGKETGMWSLIDREGEKKDGPLRVTVTGNNVIRNAGTREIIDVLNTRGFDWENHEFEAWMDERGIKAVEVLMYTADGQNIRGGDLRSASFGYDGGSPKIDFKMTTEGAYKMERLTSSNLPEGSRTRRLGIILDNTLLSAPSIQSTISDQGQITGQFTPEEVQFLVKILNAGRLPAVLNKTPISESIISPLLGIDTIIKGAWAIGISLGLVLIFMLFIYRLSGVVACIALVLNMVLILGVIIVFRATLSLPGIAGLVLTVGMSVDANVLIFERIREELERGAALRMAIRNGFARATTTIVDANVTTLITALVLYIIGTDQIRGFAATLIVGILMSMFTAIYFARFLFDFMERKRIITNLTMTSLLKGTHVDFLGKRTVAMVGSLILIVIGLVSVGMRGSGIFDIDFNGGTSADVVFQEKISVDEVKELLNKSLDNVGEFKTKVMDRVAKELEAEGSLPSEPEEKQAAIAKEMAVRYGDDWDIGDATIDKYVVEIDPDIYGDDRYYKITTSLPSVDFLKQLLEQTFTKDGKQLLETYEVKVGGEGTTSQTSAILPEGNSIRSASRGTAQISAVDRLLAEPTYFVTQDEPGTEEPAPEGPATADPVEEPSTQPEPPAEDPTTEPEPMDSAPTDPADPTEPEPMGPAEPMEPAEPTDPMTEPMAEPADPMDPVDPMPPTDPVGPVAGPTLDPADPTDPPTTDDPTTDDPSTPDGPSTDDPSEPTTDEPASAGTQKARLTFSEVYISGPSLQTELLEAMRELEIRTENEFKLQPFEEGGDAVAVWNPDSNNIYPIWDVSIDMPKASFDKVIDKVTQQLSSQPVFPTSSKIGSTVAGDTRGWALAALFASLLGIVGYIWIRFQKVVFGLAAVVALVHDVLITLGAIAVSAYLVTAFGWLQIEEFKISLPVVAAFLTIIGYSLNDTIVVFDRIREVRGKSPGLTKEMINDSINQTLNRTLLTSLTTFIVVVILYFGGGQGIHAFAFSLVVGVLVGTYSSIFIASPVLYWMVNRETAQPAPASAKPTEKGQP